MYDLVIRGGTVIDGSGLPRRSGDVAIDDGTIVAVGHVSERGHREIDARDRLVTPGFVDVHTHYDAQVSWDPYLTPSSWHGVTSVVMGNCGVGFAPAKPNEHDWLIMLMEGVEDIPGSAMVEGIRWGWESFPQYLDTIEKEPRALDFGAQIPHGALRAYVMGERGAKNEPANADDIRRMARLVKEALMAGALGFSTSRTSLHKSTDGEFVPGTFAAKDELFGIGSALKEAERGVFQLACEHTNLPDELLWIEELALETGRPISFNLSQTPFAPELWRRSLAGLERAGQNGAKVFAQVAGRAIGILFHWQGTAHPFVPCPAYQALSSLPWPERVQKLKNPEVKARILTDTPTDLGPFVQMITQNYANMFVVDGAADYEPSPEASVAAIAEMSRRDPRDVAYEALLRNDGDGMLYFPLFNYADGDLAVIHELHQHPRTMFGLSDAGAHCGAICDGGMTTFMLTHWVRDRLRGPRLSLEHVVRRQTRATAELYGLRDRGLLAPGMKADVNVIDFDRLALGKPEMVFDLPAGGRRLAQRARGYDATVVSGVVTVVKDEPTGALPGKLIRGARDAVR